MFIRHWDYDKPDPASPWINQFNAGAQQFPKLLYAMMQKGKTLPRLPPAPPPLWRGRRGSTQSTGGTSGTPTPLVSVFVSPTGSDTTGDGSEATPYASLNRVQSAVRMLLQQHGASAGNITVNVVGGGRYELDEPLVFDEGDHHAAPSARRVSWIGPPTQRGRARPVHTYISMISASNHSLHRFALDYFSLRTYG